MYSTKTISTTIDWHLSVTDDERVKVRCDQEGKKDMFFDGASLVDGTGRLLPSATQDMREHHEGVWDALVIMHAIVSTKATGAAPRKTSQNTRRAMQDRLVLRDVEAQERIATALERIAKLMEPEPAAPLEPCELGPSR